jgi:hypothetical protein
MVCFGWRGYVISEFSLVWIANIYMSAFNRLRLDVKPEAMDFRTVCRNAQSPTLQWHNINA